MRNGIYTLYITTFQQARRALALGDERWQRELCSEVAGRGGAASTVSLLAMSDAERGREPRGRRDILGVSWREVLGDRDVGAGADGHLAAGLTGGAPHARRAA